MERLSVDDRERLFSPWVMRTAWNKVKNWYTSGELHDPAEYMAWQSDPWSHLEALGQDLVDGDYCPQPFPVVPFPKKGDRLRHYAIPSVRDQVAFMAFLVLLGPLLEARMPNVSFGNRLFRPRVLHKGKWYRAPFSLNQNNVYDSFSSGYGLFRRLLQWITNEMILGKDGTGGTLDEDEPDLLPYLKHPKPHGDLLYARLDLSLAYPSVDREKLTSIMIDLLKDERTPNGEGTKSKQSVDGGRWGRPSFPDLTNQDPDAPFARWYEEPRRLSGSFVVEGQPWRELSSNERLRLGVALELGTLLQKIKYAAWDEPRGWDNSDAFDPAKYVPDDLKSKPVGTLKPDVFKRYDTLGFWPADCHLSRRDLDKQDFGLPTGLAISGLLLNVALTPIDNAMCERYFQQDDKGKRVFYLRFVDDVVLLSPSQEHMEGAIDCLRTELQTASRNFFLNPSKAKPESVQGFLRARNEPSTEIVNLRIKPSEYLTRATVETFNTTVVREMSGLAEEALEECFGAEGVDRLNELLELAARNDEDSEVGADARLSFAVNKVARASWPKPGQTVIEENRAIAAEVSVQRILMTAEKALRKHPWRFKLWKSLLIIALRANQYGRKLGEVWLTEQILPLLRWDGRSIAKSSQSWECGDGAEEYCTEEEVAVGLASEKDLPPPQPVRRRRRKNRRLRTSFHRAWFWREWATCVRALRRVAEHGETVPEPGSWLSHFTRKQSVEALDWFSKLDTWAAKMYGAAGSKYWPSGRPFLWWWEAESFRDAILASLNPTPQSLQILGDPRPLFLRQPTLSLPGIEALLPASSEPFRSINLALQNVMAYPAVHAAFQGRPRPVVQKRAVLWALRFHAHPDILRRLLEDRAMRGLAPSPGTGAADWAAVARFGMWEEWTALKDLSVGNQPPFAAETLWERLSLLDIYSEVRSLLLAHGQTLTWDSFQSWFPALRPPRASIKVPGRQKRSLLQGMYRLTAPRAPADGWVPALELSSPIAYKLASEALEVSTSGSEPASESTAPDNGAFLSPDSVWLTAEAFNRLIGARRALVEAGMNQQNDIEFDSAAVWPLVEILRMENCVAFVQPLLPSHRAPHPLYFYPEIALAQPGRQFAQAWRSALLMLWMLSGGERILDQILRLAPWHLPLSDRDDLRCLYVLPDHMWRFIEGALGTLSVKVRNPFSDDEEDSWDEVGPEEAESVIKTRDVVFDEDGSWNVRAPGHIEDDNQPTEATSKDLRVRLVQATAEPGPDIRKWATILSTLKAPMERPTFEQVAVELADRLSEARGQARIRRQESDDLLMFPEWFTPYQYLPKLRQFVRETSVAVLSGVLIREIPRAVPIVPRIKKFGWRLLVNEAVLIVPNYQPKTTKDRTATPNRIYQFFVRKPYPAANELGLVRRLQELSTVRGETVSWSFAGGIHWYRWTYHHWHSFSVAICSDILDTFIWDWLRGRIQHLFIPAWNKDIDLFDQITWTRGYELYANVATVNHGSMGGSVAWTPKRQHERELFRVHGPNKGLSVSVVLPVPDLLIAQETSLEEAIEEAKRGWKYMEPRYPVVDRKRRFKCPAPNYRKKP